MRSTEFIYDENPVLTKLIGAQQRGYQKDEFGVYQDKAYPPVSFGYQAATLGETLSYVDAESLENIPGALDGGEAAATRQGEEEATTTCCR